MLPADSTTTASRIVKLKPQAKLPRATLLQVIPPGDLKRLKRLLTDTAEYVYNELLDRPDAARLLRLPTPYPEATAASDDSGRFSLPDNHQGHQEVLPELSDEHLQFLQMNFCRRQVFRILEEHAGRRLSEEAVRELLWWEKLVAQTRGEIIRKNVPLVLAMAKRTRITGVDLTDLISDGNLALMRAVNKFDCARGYRFSTYACRSILKSFSRVAARSARHREHFPTEFEPNLEKSDLVEQSRLAAERDCVHELKTIVEQNLAGLTEVEHKVVVARFALNEVGDNPAARAQTLEQVGALIGVTKERVRQIQNKALGKLRAALEQALANR